MANRYKVGAGGSGGGGGGGGGSGPATVTKTAPTFFHAPIDVLAAAAIPAAAANVLGITVADIYVNRGAGVTALADGPDGD